MYNFDRPSLDKSLHNTLLRVSDICLGAEEDSTRNNAFLLYGLYGHALDKNHCPMSH